MSVTVSTFLKMKAEGKKISMITAYDYTTARLVDESGIDSILVGDSLGNVMLGLGDTVSVTMEDMIHHGAAVARGTKNALVVVDMPFMSYQSSVYDAVVNAGRLMKEARANAVKLEGGVEVADRIRAIVDCQIPVCAHIGLTPQGINALGGQLENAFGIDVAQLVDVAHCGINKINVDTDIRLACTRNLLELFENEPELRESASIGQLYKDLKKNPKNFDPRNYVASIMDTITLGTVPDAHVQKVVDCMKDGVTESIAPLLVQFGSYRKSHLIEVVTCEQMAERYKKAGI